MLLPNRFLLNVSFSFFFFFFLLQISWHWNADVSRATYGTQTAIKHNVSKASQLRLQGNQSTAKPRSHKINIKKKNTTMIKIIAGDWNHDNKGRNTEIKDPGLLETRFSTICICYSNGHRSSQKYLQNCNLDRPEFRLLTRRLSQNRKKKKKWCPHPFSTCPEIRIL